MNFMKRCVWILAAGLALLWCADAARAQTTKGAVVFEQHCASCHGNPTAAKPAPDVLSLWKLTAEELYAAMGKAPHNTLADVSDADWREVAFYLGRRRVDIGKVTDAKSMPNQCPANSTLGDISAKPEWNGWGNDVSNARFQNAKAAGLTADQVPHLKLKWAFGFPGAEEVYGQPTVVGGRVFLGVDTGAVYSLDAETGCVYWSYQSDAGVRTAISVGPAKAKGKYGVYFGDIRANVYMLDAQTGKEIWKVKVEDHPVAKITGAPMLYEDRLYVPVSSQEERSAGWSTVYPCCTFRGSVVALDAQTGKTIWKTYPVTDPPKPTQKNPNGVQQYGPNGGAVWNTPTIDAKNHALYIGTGDAYTKPVSKNTDAIMALDLKTGKVIWSVQDTEEDAWLSGCGGEIKSENCLPPSEIGPDYDFGASPILRTLPNGHRLLVAGQKSGMVWAHDPDRDGTVVWKTQIVKKLALGMITFGGAADDQNAYFGLRTGAIAAVRMDTGEQKWSTPIAPTPGPGPKGETAAVTAIPGAVFVGSWDGVLRAFASDDGRLLWEYNTVQDYDAVNKVPAKGGSMAAPGVTVVNGKVYAGSGYVFGAGTPGNALLVFSAE
jgi:polyvinyl alcohol dehydrogenase (cytochrome)